MSEVLNQECDDVINDLRREKIMLYEVITGKNNTIVKLGKYLSSQLGFGKEDLEGLEISERLINRIL